MLADRADHLARRHAVSRARDRPCRPDRAPKAIVTLAQFAGHDHAAMALATGVPHVLIHGGYAPEGTVDFDAAHRRGRSGTGADYAAANSTGPGEVFTIFWTSGTEARPKGVPRDQNHWVINGEMVAEAAGIVEGEVLLNPFPLVNIGSFGLVTPWLMHRGTLVLHHPFDLKVYLAQIAAERVQLHDRRARDPERAAEDAGADGGVRPVVDPRDRVWFCAAQPVDDRGLCTRPRDRGVQHLWLQRGRVAVFGRAAGARPHRSGAVFPAHGRGWHRLGRAAAPAR